MRLRNFERSMSVSVQGPSRKNVNGGLLVSTAVNNSTSNLRSLKPWSCFPIVLAMLVLVSIMCSAKEAPAPEDNIRGYVTEVTSPASFQIDSYKIAHDPKVTITVENNDPHDPLAVDNPDEIRVGTDVDVAGNLNRRTGEMKATSIKIFLEDTKRLKRTALLSEPPVLQKTENGWQGTLFADGQRVIVNEKTLVNLKLATAEERKQAWEEKSKAAGHPVDYVDSRPLSSTDVLTIDYFVRYVGTRQKDGPILAKSVEFESAAPEPGEIKMWRQFTTKIVKEPDYAASIPGELKVGRAKYKLFPSQKAQEYVSALGQKLIPAHQKELPDNSPFKIPFKFYLVEDKEANAGAYPNGVVIVNSGSFDTWQNEAQLAYVLSHEINHAIEKHTWRMSQYHKNSLLALRIGALAASGFGVPGVYSVSSMTGSGIQAAYSRSLENQADRVALQEMLNAGYDIRQAPEACKTYEHDHPNADAGTWDTHDTFVRRRSFLMSEVRNNYADTDYSKLIADSSDFHRVSAIVYDFNNEQKAKRNKKN
jgi:Peptidase family M48